MSRPNRTCPQRSGSAHVRVRMKTRNAATPPRRASRKTRSNAGVFEVMDESYPNLMAFPEEAVSLSQIQERKIALEWFEAVAIAQAAWMSADQNGNGLTSRSLVPRDVFIQADGQVNATRKLSGSPSDPYPVQRVARLLRDLLPDVFPMPLRLALTQAMSSPPFYESL